MKSWTKVSELPPIIPVNVPEGVSGPWRVYTFTVSKEEAEGEILRSIFSGNRRYVPAGTYKGLTEHGHIIMSNTPNEIQDHFPFFREAKGRVLINGLGLGVALNTILHKIDDSGNLLVTEVIVIEKSPDVLKLVQGSFKDKRIKFIQEDAFNYKPIKASFNAVWHDIWPDISGDNLKGMHKLHRKYGRVTHWQGSWGRKECERCL